jgi:hypothetical protein
MYVVNKHCNGTEKDVVLVMLKTFTFSKILHLTAVSSRDNKSSDSENMKSLEKNLSLALPHISLTEVIAMQLRRNPIHKRTSLYATDMAQSNRTK